MATLGLRFGRRARFYIELPKQAALALLTLPLCAMIWPHAKPRILQLARRLGVVRAPAAAPPAAATTLPRAPVLAPAPTPVPESAALAAR